jgi:hypothetical protein
MKHSGHRISIVIAAAVVLHAWALHALRTADERLASLPPSTRDFLIAAGGAAFIAISLFALHKIKEDI